MIYIPMFEALWPLLNGRVTPRDGGNLYYETNCADGEYVWRNAMGVVGHSTDTSYFYQRRGEVGEVVKWLEQDQTDGSALPLGGARRGVPYSYTPHDAFDFVLFCPFESFGHPR